MNSLLSKTSHKFTHTLVLLVALLALTAVSFAQVPTVGSVLPAINQIEVSDQKPGSILVFPYYTSNAQTKADTNMTISNLGAVDVIVHLFFLRGTDCQQSDQFVCLTKGASIAFKASEQDPETTGYVLAVAVNAAGRPIHRNQLIGNAFVNAGDIIGNYGAESFAAWDGQFPGVPGTQAFGVNPDGTHTIFFTGIIGGFDRPADQFAVQIQSPNDAAGQVIVHASLNGNLAGGSMESIGQAGTGLLWRGDEKQGSFVSFISGNCQSINTITGTAPRVPTGLSTFLPKSNIGTLVYATTQPSVGVIITPVQFNAGAPGVKVGTWGGIRSLHKTRTRNSTVTIPVYMPVC